MKLKPTLKQDGHSARLQRLLEMIRKLFITIVIGPSDPRAKKPEMKEAMMN